MSEKQIGIVGLGKMGSGMAQRLAEKGWQVLGFNRTVAVADELSASGVIPIHELGELKQLTGPRIVIVMVKAGEAVDELLFGNSGSVGLDSVLESGDLIIDAGNSFYKDSVRRGGLLAEKDLRFVDIGTSGGPEGARNGACLMVGGSAADQATIRTLVEDLASPNAYQFFEGIGAGHFTKMVHNGIEYGMMQAIAEGFTVLEASEYGFDLKKVATIYNNRSVIESRLIDWLRKGYEENGQELERISSVVGASGEGQWTVESAEALGVEVPIIKKSLEFRQESIDKPSYTGKILTLLRHQFGGHGTK